MCCMFLIMFQLLQKRSPSSFFIFTHLQKYYGKSLDKMISESVCDFSDCLSGSVCTERSDCRPRLSAWIRSTRGVSQLWGLCEALWARLLVSGCMFPIGCFCLTKTQWDSGLLKDAVSLSCSLQEIICFMLITSYSIDETLLFWWDHLALMGPFCVISIWMESECQCYSLIQSTGTTL